MESKFDSSILTDISNSQQDHSEQTNGQFEKKRKRNPQFSPVKKYKTEFDARCSEILNATELQDSRIRVPEFLSTKLTSERLIETANSELVKGRVSAVIEMVKKLGVTMVSIDQNISQTNYKILASGDHYFVIYPAVVHKKENMVMRLGQDLDSGAWHIIKSYEISDKKYVSDIDAEIELLKTVNQFTVSIDENSQTVHVIKPYVYGKDLTQWLHLDLNKKIEIFVYVTAALNELHKKGILHCDIKLSNIIYDDLTNTVTLIDFDVALRMNEKQTAITDTFRGTFGQVAVEIFGSDGTYTYTDKTEVYALGRTMEDWFDLNQDVSHSNLSLNFFKPHLSSQQSELNSLIGQTIQKDAMKRPDLNQIRDTLMLIMDEVNTKTDALDVTL
ncbi:protein kinase domain-containing protein [Legionella bononiensis]|uniref:Protein kinase family protein n=1 Tax=Legionella bononiensis TaxID=2793102 RepID=A0ABS1W7Z0_9GAMM|nr:protein kinase [Legionella bononiensis]MBL7480002.1 protein kinase family protein [Legionella bononiensis]MBL7525484.1 protein kinase family protein [Legionella bononiensis]MBL7561667.1 protein kinase family protein [Legionella bononiensis]